MDKAKIFMNGKSQAVRLPKKYRFDCKEVLVQEHELGLLIIDPEKRWKALERVMGSMGDDFFPDGYKDDSV
jgi:antitoxin VapB